MTIRIRTGLVGKKLGMTNIFTESGDIVAVTLVEITNNYVCETRKLDGTEFSKVKIAFSELSPNKISKTSLKVKTPEGEKFFAHAREFKVATDELPEQGRKLSVEHFQDGQFVDVTGVSIGKGFAGSMKRHNFSGLKASHGVSISHRAHGSTGQCQDPGRVFKGKKMAGHMGANRVTVQNLRVEKVDSELSIIAISGAIPGSKNSTVYINDAIKLFVDESLPFPAKYDGKLSEDSGKEMSSSEISVSESNKNESEA